MDKMSKIIYAALVSAILLSVDAVAQEKSSERDIENRIITAVQKYDERDFRKASEILRDVIAEAPDNDAAHFYLGLSGFCLNDMDTAEREMSKAVSLDPGNFWYRYRLAMLYSATDRKDLAISMYEDILEDFPKKSDLYYGLIDLYISQNEMDKALEVLAQIETVFGRTEATALARFDLLLNLGRRDEAYRSLQKFNEEYSSPQVLSMLGDYQMSMYNDSLALESYDEALELVPDYAPAILGKSEVYRVTRRYDEYFPLMETFMASESVTPAGKADYMQSLFRRSDPLFLKSFSAELDSMVNGCVSRYPNDSSILMTAGVYYYGTERPDAAKMYFRRNMDFHPESLSAAASYVELLMYMSAWDELSSEGRAAFRRFPSEPTFLEMASVADYNLGEYGKVLDICDTVLAVSAGDSVTVLNAYTTMGDMYHQLGETKKAYKAYDEALKINPEHLPVLNNYAYFLSMEGRSLKKAYAMSRITVEKEPDNPTYLDTFAWILHLQGKDLEAKPFFKHAMLYGGKESAVILDHYAEVLFSLGEYDLAFVYWNQAKSRNNGEIPDLDERVRVRKEQMKNR